MHTCHAFMEALAVLLHFFKLFNLFCAGRIALFGFLKRLAFPMRLKSMSGQAKDLHPRSC